MKLWPVLLVITFAICAPFFGCECSSMSLSGDDDDDDDDGDEIPMFDDVDDDAADDDDAGDDDAGDDDADDDDSYDDDVDDDDSCDGLVINKRGYTQLCEPAGVRVVFSVADCDNNPVQGLTGDNFTVINDETGQPFLSEGGSSALMEALDFEFYSILLLDLSYSIIDNNRLNDVINGAETFVEMMIAGQPEGFKHYIGIYVFGSTDASEFVHDFTQDSASLNATLEELRNDPGRGSTNLYGAFAAGLDLVDDQGSGEMISRSLVILTDGTHETGDRETMREYATTRLENSNARSYSIGIRGDYNEDDLLELASSPENFVMVDEASELVDAFESVSALLEAWSRSNYVIGVCSPLEGPNRSLTIQAEKDDLFGEIQVQYSAVGFNLVDCDSEAVAQGEQCRNFNPSGDSRPEISNGFWDPDIVGGGGDLDSLLKFSVCDEDNDLSGGEVYTWLAGTSVPFFGSFRIFWDDFTNGAPDCPNCDNPFLIGGIPTPFDGWNGTICCDVEVTDGRGNLSNKLRDICITILP